MRRDDQGGFMVEVIFLLKDVAMPRSYGRAIISVDSSERPRGRKEVWCLSNRKRTSVAQV